MGSSWPLRAMCVRTYVYTGILNSKVIKKKKVTVMVTATGHGLPCADLPPPFSSGRGGPWWRVAPVVSRLALTKGLGNSLISLVDLVFLK